MTQEKTVIVGVSDVFFYTKIRDAFRPAGYSLKRIKTHEGIIENLKEFEPVAILLNMNDPGLNAMQILETIKGDARLQKIPVLAFANHEEVNTWRQAKELGISKIVSRNEFSSRTLELLEEVTRQTYS